MLITAHIVHIFYQFLQFMRRHVFQWGATLNRDIRPYSKALSHLMSEGLIQASLDCL